VVERALIPCRQPLSTIRPKFDPTPSEDSRVTSALAKFTATLLAWALAPALPTAVATKSTPVTCPPSTNSCRLVASGWPSHGTKPSR
jgi:hypothetical protein